MTYITDSDLGSYLIYNLTQFLHQSESYSRENDKQYLLKSKVKAGLKNIVIFSKISKISDFFYIFDTYIKHLHIHC